MLIEARPVLWYCDKMRDNKDLKLISFHRARLCLSYNISACYICHIDSYWWHKIICSHSFHIQFGKLSFTALYVILLKHLLFTLYSQLISYLTLWCSKIGASQTSNKTIPLVTDTSAKAIFFKAVLNWHVLRRKAAVRKGFLFWPRVQESIANILRAVICDLCAINFE